MHRCVLSYGRSDEYEFSSREMTKREVLENCSRKIEDGFVGQKMIALPPDVKERIVKNKLIHNFFLTAIGYYPHAVYHDRNRKAGSPEYILLYCVEGRGTVLVGCETNELKPNTYIILPNNIPHHYKSSTIDPWSIYWVHFTGKNAELLYNRHFETHTGVSYIPVDEKRNSTFDEIFSLLENSFEVRDMEIVNIKILEYISSFIYHKEINPSIKDEDVISQSVLYMKKNIGMCLSISTLAGEHRLSVSHYTRLFRAKTGVSPIQYFNQLKVQKCCQYLYFTDRNIKEICSELGFSDPYYFSRLFKKLMGLSPSNYKNQHKHSQ